MAPAARANLTTIASFPPHFLLENLAVRADGSILVTVLNRKQLWYVPAPIGGQPVTPVPVHTFDGFAMGIVETEPDIFYVSTVDPATLERFDMRGWVPGAPVKPTRILTFDQPAALNGACLMAPHVILLADSLAGLIWRVDLADDGLTATASVWLRHHTMASDPDNGFTSPLGPQPGINGIRFAARTNVVYYTSTGHKLFMRGLGAWASRLRPHRLRDHRRRPHGHRVPPPRQRRNHPPRAGRSGAVRARKASTMSGR